MTNLLSITERTVGSPRNLSNSWHGPHHEALNTSKIFLCSAFAVASACASTWSALGGAGAGIFRLAPINTRQRPMPKPANAHRTAPIWDAPFLMPAADYRNLPFAHRCILASITRACKESKYRHSAPGPYLPRTVASGNFPPGRFVPLPGLAFGVTGSNRPP